MKIETSRFGALDVTEEQVFEFPEGFAGFESRSFALIPHKDDPKTWWLQSMVEPEVAVLILEPSRLRPDYDPKPRSHELHPLEASEGSDEQLRCCVIAWADDTEGKLRVNFFAPLYLNIEARRALQIPLVGSSYGARELWPPA